MMTIGPLDFDTTGAACLGVDPEIFHPVSSHPRDAARAKAVCAGCGILDACREWAIVNLPEGVWGGATHDERRAMRRRETRRRYHQRTRAGVS